VFSLKLYLRQRGLTLLAHRITVTLARTGAQNLLRYRRSGPPAAFPWVAMAGE
jgi:hypothetical protein